MARVNQLATPTQTPGLMSEAALEQRPAAFGRAQDIVRQPLVQAKNRLGQLQSQARQLNESGLLGTPGLVTGDGEGEVGGDVVIVQAANGEIVQIPRQHLQEAIRRGARVVQE